MTRDAYVRVSTRLFVIGVRGRVRNKRSVLVVLMCIELRLLAVNRQRRAHSVFRDDVRGQVFARVVLTVAAGESAVGLAVRVVYYRVHGTIAMRTMNRLSG